MNEMAGVFALLKFHDRWLNGARPKNGNNYVATGKIERALELNPRTIPILTKKRSQTLELLSSAPS